MVKCSNFIHKILTFTGSVTKLNPHRNRKLYIIGEWVKVEKVVRHQQHACHNPYIDTPPTQRTLKYQTTSRTRLSEC